jgi:excisionase family DNA binding protein
VNRRAIPDVHRTWGKPVRATNQLHAHCSQVNDLQVSNSDGSDVSLTQTNVSIDDAARMLDVSTTFVVRLIGQGKLRAADSGTDTVIHAAELADYLRRRDERLDGLRELTRLDEELGLTY